MLAWFFCVFLLPALLPVQNVIAEHAPGDLPAVGILYPTVSKQYSGMFEQYLNGIQSIQDFRFFSYRITASTTEDDINKWIEENQLKAFIALGQTTYRLLDNLDSDKPLIAGGMVATPPGISGISLSGDPEAFFRQLQLLNPGINRVFFVYSEKNNGWVIERARKVSRKYNIEFVPLRVKSIKQATLQYKVILQSVQSDTDALWIPLDDIAPLDILLPDILQVTWDKHITVFSNNMQHARRGTLFALYPDHEKQGRRLVALLKRHLENPNTPKLLYPSVDFKTAVNIRTATHLGLRYSKKMLQSFDQIFPAYK